MYLYNIYQNEKFVGCLLTVSTNLKYVHIETNRLANEILTALSADHSYIAFYLNPPTA